jgi:hypothetical protein
MFRSKKLEGGLKSRRPFALRLGIATAEEPALRHCSMRSKRMLTGLANGISHDRSAGSKGLLVSNRGIASSLMLDF